MQSVRILLTAMIAVVVYAVATPASAQFLSDYDALEQITYATSIAKDSIGDDAVLVGIATAGEIDFPGIGTIDGFDDQTGESSAWAYQFLTPNGDEGIAVGVVKFADGTTLGFTERGNDFELQVKALITTGAFANSDAFVARLKTNQLWQQYKQQYPNVLPTGVVLSWEPDDTDLLPNDFPVDLPLWAIFYGTESDEPTDSTMICFTATGSDGETHCVRLTASSVEDPSGDAGLVTMNLTPNPAQRSGTAMLRIASGRLGGRPDEVAVYNSLGALVMDLTDNLVADGAEGHRAELNLRGLAAGSYVCRVVRGNTIRSIRMIVD